MRESVAAPEVTSTTLAAGSVNGGKSTSGSFVLSTPAPAGGIWVYTDSTSRFTANPSSVLVPAGGTRGTFDVTTKRISVTTTVTISA